MSRNERIAFIAGGAFAIAAAVAVLTLISGPSFARTGAGPEPLTLPVLRLMPDTAEAVFAAPPIADFRMRVLEMTEALTGKSSEIESAMDEVVAKLAEEFELPEGTTLEEALAHTGFDAYAPMGLIIDAEPIVREAENALEVQDVDVDGEDFHIDFGAVPPGIAIVIGVTDAQVAQDTLDTLLPDTVTTYVDEQVDGIFVRTYGEEFLSYFFANGQMVLGNGRDFVFAIARRANNPATVRYGTADCPATSADEFAALIRMDRASDFIFDIADKLADNEHAIPEELQQLRDSFSEDPLVLTVEIAPDHVEVLARLDLERHAGLRELLGPPSALRLAKVVPGDAAGFLSIRFNEQSQNILAKAATAIAGALDEGETVEFFNSEMIQQWPAIIGDEFTLAFLERGEEKAAVGLLAVNSRDALSNVLQAVPGELAETHRNIDILRLPFDEFEGLYYVNVRSTLIMGSDLDAVREIVDNLLDGRDSGLLASFDPPIDADLPRYAGVFAKGTITQGLNFGGDGPSRDVIRDLRASADVEGTWLATRLVANLNPIEALAAD